MYGWFTLVITIFKVGKITFYILKHTVLAELMLMKGLTFIPLKKLTGTIC